jgi:S-adenosylmethionine hydrolase
MSPNIGNIPIRSAKLVLSTGERLPLVKTFAEISRNSIAGVIGSSGLIEIAADRDRADNQFPALKPGASVSLEW